MEDEGGEGRPIVPARMLNEFCYCPRLFFLEFVQGEFEHSADTLEGKHAHKRVESERGTMPPPDGVEDAVEARAVMLSSERLGMVAKVDIVEGEGGEARPVDYKKSSIPEVEGGAWEPEKVQLCVQGLILRDNGYRCDEGVIYYAGSNRRVTVLFTDELVELTLKRLEEARQVVREGRIPPPLVDSPKCPRCSLVGICLPDEVTALSEAPGWSGSLGDVRRLFPGRDDALPVYVQEQGATVGKAGDVIEIRKGREMLQKAKLIDTSQLCLFGNISVTPAAVKMLCDRGIPICHFSYGGWFYGITTGLAHKNVELRRLQYAAAEDEEKAVEAARAFVAGKVRNCRTLVRRNHPRPPRAALQEMARLARLAGKAESLGSLLGLEGAASQTYFAHFAGMIKAEGSEGDGFDFDFKRRNRRPPMDPINALLSYTYAILGKDMTVVAQSVGFDPYLGLFHKPKYGRPSLALDLMEEFRPIVCDSTVLSLVNTGEIGPADFLRRGPAVSIKRRSRKRVLRAYHRRLDTMITHPIFDYRISYRRVFEVQTRLLGRWLAGEIPRYPPFCTR
jgi:CRISPR-associated protein Cas1